MEFAADLGDTARLQGWHVWCLCVWEHGVVSVHCIISVYGIRANSRLDAQRQIGVLVRDVEHDRCASEGHVCTDSCEHYSDGVESYVESIMVNALGKSKLKP
jgi:hypothetical protein